MKEEATSLKIGNLSLMPDSCRAQESLLFIVKTPQAFTVCLGGLIVHHSFFFEVRRVLAQTRLLKSALL